MSKIANLGGKKSKVGWEGSFFPNIIIDDISLKMGHPTWCYSSQVVKDRVHNSHLDQKQFLKGEEEKIIKGKPQNKKTFSKL